MARDVRDGLGGNPDPGEYGGSGLDMLTLGLVLEETGRTLTASPLCSTALVATSALLLSGNDAQKRRLAARNCRGEALGALAVDEGAHHAPEKIALAATRDGAGFKLTGKKSFVLDGGTADVLVVAARTSGKPGEAAGITLFLVPGDAKGLARTKLKSVDNRGVANLEFAGVAVGADAVLGR